MMVARRRSVPGVHDSLGRESITKCRVRGFAMDFRGYIPKRHAKPTNCRRRRPHQKTRHRIRQTTRQNCCRRNNRWRNLKKDRRI